MCGHRLSNLMLSPEVLEWGAVEVCLLAAHRKLHVRSCWPILNCLFSRAELLSQRVVLMLWTTAMDLRSLGVMSSTSWVCSCHFTRLPIHLIISSFYLPSTLSWNHTTTVGAFLVQSWRRLVLFLVQHSRTWRSLNEVPFARGVQNSATILLRIRISKAVVLSLISFAFCGYSLGHHHSIMRMLKVTRRAIRRDQTDFFVLKLVFPNSLSDWVNCGHICRRLSRLRLSLQAFSFRWELFFGTTSLAKWLT